MSKHSARRTILVLALAAVSGGVLAQKAAKVPQAAPWPTKPLRLLVGFPGGSTPDLVARTIAEPLSRALGQPVVVENRPGAGGNIAADIVAKSTDNHTIGVMINGNMTIAKLLNPATPFDPLKDLAPISLIGTAPLAAHRPGHRAGQQRAGILRGRPQCGRQVELWHTRHRHRGTHRHGTAQDQDQHPSGPCALSRKPAGHQRDDRRPDPSLAAAAWAGGGTNPGRQTQGGRRHLRRTQPAGARISQPRRRRRPGLSARNLDRRRGSGFAAQAHRGQAVLADRRDRAHPRGAAKAVPAGLAGGGHLVGRPGQSGQGRHRAARRRDRRRAASRPSKHECPDALPAAARYPARPGSALTRGAISGRTPAPGARCRSGCTAAAGHRCRTRSSRPSGPSCSWWASCPPPSCSRS